MEVKKTKGILTKMMKMALKIGKITILTSSRCDYFVCKKYIAFPLFFKYKPPFSKRLSLNFHTPRPPPPPIPYSKIWKTSTFPLKRNHTMSL